MTAERAATQTRPLTPPEREIVRMLAAGYKARAIAEVRGRSYNTVRKQIAMAYEKLGITDRLGLFIWASRDAGGVE